MRGLIDTRHVNDLAELANWRMQLAKQMMRDGTSSIQEVATRVGYDSEAAFNRAFKRVTGSPPAAWRKGALGAT